VCVFFLTKGFCREAFLFCGVIVSIGGFFSIVAFHPPCCSPLSPPPFPFSSSSPPPREQAKPIFFRGVVLLINLYLLDLFLLFLLLCPTRLSDKLDLGDHGDSYGVIVKDFGISNRYKEFLWPFLCDMLHVFIYYLVVRL
jgi:hypothetical protein